MYLYCLILVARLDLLGLQKRSGDGKILLIYNIDLILLNVLISVDMESVSVGSDLSILVSNDGRLLRFWIIIILECRS